MSLAAAAQHDQEIPAETALVRQLRAMVRDRDREITRLKECLQDYRDGAISGALPAGSGPHLTD